MGKTINPKLSDDSELVAETTADLHSTWKEAPQMWGHSLHRLSPYIGGFPPALAHYFIRRFSDVGDVVLDPFCGGGTTPLEAALHNRYGYGNDAFSYAHILTKAKCNPLADAEFEHYLDKKLAQADTVDNTDMQLLDDEDLTVFYSDYTLDQILRLREVISDDDSIEGAYLKGLICGILHGPSQMFLSLQTKDTYSGTANYVREYAEEHGLTRPERDIRPRALQKHNRACKDYVPPWLNEQTKITESDARELPFEQGSVNLIVTSPPYMQTLNYTWNNWLRLWWLDENRESEREKLDITADTSKYRKFIRECLTEMYDILSPDSVAVLIVGDVQKHLANKTRTLNTAAYIAEEAREHTGFDVYGIINDAYDVDNRSYVVFNRLKYDHDDDREKKDTIDRCVILKKESPEMADEPNINWDKKMYQKP